jgi:endonuclease/exonuclease/phosphatase family metal-dependent hydrolase
VAWWNVENLFDEENAPVSRRPDKVTRAIGANIVGWTPQLRDRKIDQLASVIARMNNAAGPDLLGVCEVENRFVLERLAARVNALVPARAYELVHADTVDERGIDVAFLYDPTWLTVPAQDAVFYHVVMRRTATREIVQVNFTTDRGRTLAVFGNHWPSRSGGQAESAGYRHIAAETLAYFHQRVLEVHDRATPVLAMGDFNDEPFDISLVVHALSTRQQRKVVNATTVPRLWNLMWPQAGLPQGSFYFDSQPNVLDQMMVNKNMATSTAPIRAVAGSVEILRYPDTFTGSYQEPRPFGGMGKPVDRDGFSDHFPIAMQIIESD